MDELIFILSSQPAEQSNGISRILLLLFAIMQPPLEAIQSKVAFGVW